MATSEKFICGYLGMSSDLLSLALLARVKSAHLKSAYAKRTGATRTYQRRFELSNLDTGQE
jgi:hypothetical protein